MKAIAASSRDENVAALMADQAALVIAGMLFGGCDLGEFAESAAEPSADTAACRDQRNLMTTADAA